MVRDFCLDLSQLTSPSVTVPSNTTRVDKDAFDICLPIITNTTAVDLVFAVDQSGSMRGNDIDYLTPVATTAAVNLINKLSPKSNVGYFGFENGVCDGTGSHIGGYSAGTRKETPPNTAVLPAPLDEGTQLEKLLEQTSYTSTDYSFSCGNLSGGETNYNQAFVMAEKWLNQMDTKNKQIIIFLTDGHASTEEDEFKALVENADPDNFPIVHAIFVGEGTNIDLESLVEKTKGLYAQIEDFTRLEEVMQIMIGTSIIPVTPDSTYISKNGTFALGTTSHASIGNSRFNVNLPNDLALDLGSNQIKVSSNTSGVGLKENSVKIDVNGPPETTTGTKSLPGSDLFELACYEGSTLTPMDMAFTQAIQQLGAYNATGFGVALKTPAEDITAIVKVQGKGDMENVTLTTADSGYQGPASYSNTVTKIPGNGIVEGLVGETLSLSWVHPFDPRDTASAAPPIYDNRLDTTIIIFKDMKGNVISELNDLAEQEFQLVVIDNKATGSFPVQLNTTHNDALTVTVQNTGPRTFEATVPFGFPLIVDPTNKVIEGVFDSTSSANQTTVTAKVKNKSRALLLRKIFTPDTTDIIFTDMNGKILTELNTKGGVTFKLVVKDNKAVESLTVLLTTSDGDALNVVVTKTGPQRFEAMVPFGFSNPVNPANTLIEGLYDQTSPINQTTITAKVKKITRTLPVAREIIPVTKTWITDHNADGKGDRVYIQYKENIQSLPIYVSDIRWPSALATGKNAAADKLSFFNNDESIVLIDLSSDPFEFGATDADQDAPPILTLPDGRKSTIQDSIKPLLISVEKKPSEFGYYMRESDGSIHPFPDTLIVTLSEALAPIPTVPDPWKTLLLAKKDNKFMPVNIVAEPVVISDDGRTLQVVFENRPDTNTIYVGDDMLLNPKAAYFDQNHNIMNPLATILTGRDGSNSGLATAWRGGPVSGEQEELTLFKGGPKIPIINDNGQVVGHTYTRKWKMDHPDWVGSENRQHQF